MPHGRRQIREAVAALIATNGVPVELSRQYPMNESEMPRYLVYTIREDIDRNMSTSGGVMRELSLVVEAVIVGDESTVDDDLDGHSVYLESRLNYTRINGLVVDTFLSQSEMAIRTDGDRSLGVLTLTFTVRYRTLPTNPETIT